MYRVYNYLKQKSSAVIGAVLREIRRMSEYLKQKSSGAVRRFKKTSKRRRVGYLLLAVGIAICFTVLAIFQAKVNKTAAKEFLLAASYYQEAQNAEEKEEKLEKFQEARLLYESIRSKFWVKDKRRALFYLGSCLYSLGEYEEARKVLQRFESKYRNDYFAPWTKIKLASIYEQLQEYEKAVETYEKILKRYPESSLVSQAFLGVARCQKLQGKRSEAQKSYEELISRYPLSEEKKIAEAMIQRLEAEE